MSMRYDKTADGIMVQVVSSSPTDDEWRKLLDFMGVHKSALRAVIVFVHANDGLSAKQRSELAEVLKGMRRGFRTAVMTDSQVTRGILTALNWLTKKQDDSKTFAPDAFDDAMTFLGAGAPESRAVRELAHKLGAFAKPGKVSAK
jgi:hypothetical protein